MAKQGHQQAPDPVDATDLVSKGYADTNYASNQVLAAAGGDYIYVSIAGTQAYAADTAIALDTTETSRGDLSLTAGQVATLKAGRTYQLIGACFVTHSSAAAIPYQWYNATAAAAIGDDVISRTVNSTASHSHYSPAAYVFTPDEDTTVELRMLAGGTAGSDIAQCWAMITEIGAVQADVVGGLEFMDIIEVAADTTSVSFGASGDGQFQRAMDGDVDEEYELSLYIPDAGEQIYISLRPNGISTNQIGARGYQGSASGQTTYSTLNVAAPSSGYHSYSRGVLTAKTGRHRFWRSDEAVCAVTGAGVRYTMDNAGRWEDTTTNITSLEIFCTVTSGIKAGARFVLWRKTPNNLRADSADSYERSVESAVEVGSDTTEQTTGHTAYAGSVVGLTARIEEAVTAGTVTVNLKVDGSTTLSVELNTTDTTSKRGTANIGVHSFGPDKNVSVEIVAASYDNASSITSGITVVATLVNSALIHVPDSKDVESRLWVPPESPHSLDDEFQSTVLDSSWSVDPAASASALDVYANFASGGPRYAIHTDWRRSWMMVQSDGNVGYVHRAYTLPTNVLIWAECTCNLGTTVGNNDVTIGIGFSATGGGAPDSDDAARLFLHELDAGITQAEFNVNEGGSNAYLNNTTDIDRQGTALCYVALQKIGSVLHGWVGNSSGSWIYMGSHTYAGAAMDRVYCYFKSNTAVSPGNPISGINFIRFVESATFLP